MKYNIEESKSEDLSNITADKVQLINKKTAKIPYINQHTSAMSNNLSSDAEKELTPTF